MSRTNGEAASTGLSGGDGLKVGKEKHPTSKAKSESKQVKFHPLADMFPLMEGAEFDELVADIKANGQHARIVLKDGMILDGRNRYRACCKLGIEASFVCDAYSDQIKDPTAYVISANIRRRHLAAEQKRDLIAKLLIADPAKSDRRIAKTTGVSNTHVGKVRKELEKSGDVSTVDTRTDTKGRAQPAKKAVKKPPPADDFVESVVFGPAKPADLNTEAENFLRAHSDAVLPYFQMISGESPSLHGSVQFDEAECALRVKGMAKCYGFAVLESASTADLWKALRRAYKRNTGIAAAPAIGYQPDTVVPSAPIQESGDLKVAMRDFCTFTILNIDSGDLKLSGDPERMRKWRDLKDRVKAEMNGRSP